jgi:hypothetical protein
VLTVRWYALRGRYQGLDAPLSVGVAEESVRRG